LTGGGEVGGDINRSNPLPLFPLPPGEGKRDTAGSVEPLQILHQRWTVQERLIPVLIDGRFKTKPSPGRERARYLISRLS